MVRRGSKPRARCRARVRPRDRRPAGSSVSLLAGDVRCGHVRSTAAAVRIGYARSRSRPWSWKKRLFTCSSGSSRTRTGVDTIRPEAMSKRQRAAVDQAERLLSARFEASLSLGDIAQRVGLSPYQLCRAFRSATGRTLGEYRQHLRIRSSLERLSETSESITDIALGLGFSSHSHFTYSFRREFGFAPSTVRPSRPRRSTR